MAQHWIGREFARTGLPKTALATYLGIDNAAVSRTLTLERQLSPEESDLARAFFSIVPENAEEELTEAIRRLRSTKAREAAGVMLSEWLLHRITPKQELLFTLLQKVVSRTATLRADQIVALCRYLRIGVDSVILGRIPDHRWPNDNGGIDVLAALQKEARRWLKGQGPTYQFDRTAEPTAPRVSASKTNFIMLQPADTPNDDMAAYIPYLVPNDSYAPRFEQGQTIFLDPESEPRNGDYVAAVLKYPNPAEIKAVLGRLLYVSRSQVSILSSKGIRMELTRGDVAKLHRVVYCKL